MTTRNSRTLLGAGASSLAAAALLALGTGPAIADGEPIAVEALSDRHAFPDDVSTQITLGVEGLPEEVIELEDATNLMIYKFTVQPGGMFPWHTHPGTSFSAVTEGELIYIYADDCIERSYPAGTALVDPGFGNVHTAYNPSDEDELVVVGAFFGAPDEGEVTQPVADDEAAALDEACGIDRS